MKVCGFSFVRNAIKLDFPIKEALLSIEPICDEIIIAVGNSDDATLELVKSIHPKIRVIETVWDENLKQRGEVLADETNKAFNAIGEEFDWAFYIQGDEVVHEKYLNEIKCAMESNLDEGKVDGLLFNYLHFFGSYKYVGTKHSWYRREIRIIRNRKDIYSYRDAQGFRKQKNKKLRVKHLQAYIYHYGWVKDPKIMHKKIESNSRLYSRNTTVAADKICEFENSKQPVIKFRNTHPCVMNERVEKDWEFNPDESVKYASTKDWIKSWIGKLTGWIPGEYKNYKVIN